MFFGHFISIDNALQNVLPQWFELGLLDPSEDNPWSSLDLDSVYESHVSLAYKAAVDSMILLKNDNNNKLHLPLSSGTNNTYTFAVVGPCADNTICYQGDYNAEPLNYSTILNAFTNEYGQNNIIYAQGCTDTQCSHTNGFQAVLDAVVKADVVVYVGGISSQQESEGHDRDEIELPYTNHWSV